MRANYRVYQGGDAAYSDQAYVQESIVSESTPFFHVDLFAAVRTAEKLGLEEEEESESDESGPSGSSQVDILIDLQN